MKKSILYAVFTIIIFFHGTNSDAGEVTQATNNIKLSGGVSGGYYLSNNSGNPGKSNYSGVFNISNLLIVLNFENNSIPLSFEGGIGGSFASAVVDTPTTSFPALDIQFADFIFAPSKHVNFETGILQPNSGYEDSYTFNNKHNSVGVIASQQPFNAMGIRSNISLKDFVLFGGFYKDRLDPEEYSFGTTLSSVSYEFGFNGNIGGIDISVYHYHINNIRNLTGFVMEKEINSLYFSLNIDYWRWSKNIRQMNGKSSVVGALYISKTFGGNFELPLRLEYINQGTSRIYIDYKDVSNIFAFTVTPTYNFSDNSYFRIEGGVVSAKEAFTDNKGNVKNEKIFSSVETGIRF